MLDIGIAVKHLLSHAMARSAFLTHEQVRTTLVRVNGMTAATVFVLF